MNVDRDLARLVVPPILAACVVALLLEPMYLQDAFITVAKKAGKQVPAER